LYDSANDATPKERKVDAQVQEDAGRKKRKKAVCFHSDRCL
jgi:hypothetical protein